MNTLNEKTHFEGKILKLITKKFEVKNQCIDAEIIRHPGAVVIAATHDNVNFYLVEQFRFAPELMLLEFPAGKLEINEDPFEAAKRELVEEIGYEANSWHPLGSILSAPAFLDERLYLYYATDLTFKGQSLDSDEELSIKTFTIPELEHMIMNDTLQDAKTIALVMKLKNYLSSL